jgi:hypothetical protein
VEAKGVIRPKKPKMITFAMNPRYVPVKNVARTAIAHQKQFSTALSSHSLFWLSLYVVRIKKQS